MLGKIKVVADPEIGALFPGTKRAVVTITTISGRSHTARVDHAKGRPENPMTDEEVIAKFRANAAAVMNSEQQERVIAATWGLGEQELSIAEYMRLLIV